ncbi:uncharacterized protein [Manis javanica]|uniref:uncharacterized protein n=1 Tax=Manis javanica TaxID=9974 RepID=UPI003C6D0778
MVERLRGRRAAAAGGGRRARLSVRLGEGGREGGGGRGGDGGGRRGGGRGAAERGRLGRGRRRAEEGRPERPRAVRAPRPGCSCRSRASSPRPGRLPAPPAGLFLIPASLYLGWNAGPGSRPLGCRSRTARVPRADPDAAAASWALLSARGATGEQDCAARRAPAGRARKPGPERQILMMVRMAVVRIVMMVMTTANLDFLLLSVMMFSIFMTFHHYHNRT